MTSERGLLLTPSGPDVARFGVGFPPLELEELACEFTEEEFPSVRRGGDHCFLLLLLLDLADEGVNILFGRRASMQILGVLEEELDEEEEYGPLEQPWG
eukprot:CAMPEP_0175120740 /NCGR_PEP_ID=MMETSP0087-20121206/787_1 /TAXON_ID=136419 /ORGANISM="Unknown Unknown, Strain D1" /LENGTH=98 /DNA_ID=CAMNT_0016402217 /DNA_START=1044 /DNA_END=1340 /DNA_ORIENTATION=+